MIFDLQKGYKKIISKQKSEIIDLVKSLTKWVVKRELEDDGDYLKRLLDNLISEVDSKSILILHVRIFWSKLQLLCKQHVRHCSKIQFMVFRTR